MRESVEFQGVKRDDNKVSLNTIENSGFAWWSVIISGNLKCFSRCHSRMKIVEIKSREHLCCLKLLRLFCVFMMFEQS